VLLLVSGGSGWAGGLGDDAGEPGGGVEGRGVTGSFDLLHPGAGMAAASDRVTRLRVVWLRVPQVTTTGRVMVASCAAGG